MVPYHVVDLESVFADGVVAYTHRVDLLSDVLNTQWDALHRDDIEYRPS
jgi:hypothetical protein